MYLWRILEMATEYPEWATEKQIEGMKLFTSVVDEYLFQVSVEFKETDFEDVDNDSRFYAIVSWEKPEKGKREHTFDIAFDYEPTWNHLGERIHEWQFLFSGGEATREVSNEILFMDLFFYLDKTATTEAA